MPFDGTQLNETGRLRWRWSAAMRNPTLLIAALALSAGAAFAQQPAPSKADQALNTAWQQVVAAAETAAISGPDQLRAAKAAQDALQGWLAEQRQKLADQQKASQAALSAAEKDRAALQGQVASLTKQLAEARALVSRAVPAHPASTPAQERR